MGVPEGKKIPEGKLEQAATKGGKLGKRARFAMTLEGLRGAASSRLKEIGKK